MRPFAKILNGLLPVILIITGLILRLRNATAFLGLVAFGLAAIVLCYSIFNLLSDKYKKVTRMCSMVLTIILTFGFLVACVTGAFIGAATSGDRKDDLKYIVVLGAKVNETAPSRTLRERRFLFYFGIIGLVTFIAFFCKVARVCSERFPKYATMFMLVLSINMIVWLKVATDIFLVFAIFLCISKEDNDEYEKADEDTLSDPLDI